MAARYYIHPGDMNQLLYVDPVFKFVLPTLLSTDVIETDRARFDGVAMAFACSDEQAVAMIGVIRTKWNRYQVRCWEARSGRLVRI